LLDQLIEVAILAVSQPAHGFLFRLIPWAPIRELDPPGFEKALDSLISRLPVHVSAVVLIVKGFPISFECFSRYSSNKRFQALE
jgi:hypothetical protein